MFKLSAFYYYFVLHVANLKSLDGNNALLSFDNVKSSHLHLYSAFYKIDCFKAALQ